MYSIIFLVFSENFFKIINNFFLLKVYLVYSLKMEKHSTEGKKNVAKDNKDPVFSATLRFKTNNKIPSSPPSSPPRIQPYFIVHEYYRNSPIKNSNKDSNKDSNPDSNPDSCDNIENIEDINDSSDAEESSEELLEECKIPEKTNSGDKGLMSYLIGGALLSLTAGTIIWFSSKND